MKLLLELKTISQAELAAEIIESENIYDFEPSGTCLLFDVDSQGEADYIEIDLTSLLVNEGFEGFEFEIAD